jgi:acyl carrier protein
MIPTITRLKSELSELLVIEEIEDTATLETIGADSLDIVDISHVIAEEFGVDVPESEIKLSTTVAELAAMIENKH